MKEKFNSPRAVIKTIMEGATGKVSMPFYKMLILGIMAGIFIALGGATSSTAAHSISNVGLARLVSGAIFPIGLMMVVFIGGELFTGNCMTILGIWSKRFAVSFLVKDLVIVWICNFIGAGIVDLLIFYSGNLDYSGGLLGAYTIKVAVGKTSLSFLKAFCSGILCNLLVCIAILMATASQDLSGKIGAIFFPIMAFVVGGFEHCVANMFYIPTGMLAATRPDYVDKAIEAYGVTREQISFMVSYKGLFNNLVPVTIGNIIGGIVFVALPYYIVHIRNSKKVKNN